MGELCLVVELPTGLPSLVSHVLLFVFKRKNMFRQWSILFGCDLSCGLHVGGL